MPMMIIMMYFLRIFTMCDIYKQRFMWSLCYDDNEKKVKEK